jgi:hypothetical protein
MAAPTPLDVFQNIQLRIYTDHSKYICLVSHTIKCPFFCIVRTHVSLEGSIFPNDRQRQCIVLYVTLRMYTIHYILINVRGSWIRGIDEYCLHTLDNNYYIKKKHLGRTRSWAHNQNLAKSSPVNICSVSNYMMAIFP